MRILILALAAAAWLGRWYQRDSTGTTERAAPRTGAVATTPAPASAPSALLPATTASHTTSAAPPTTAPPASATTDVRFETDPPGAALALDGVQACVTPCTRALARDASVAVTLSLRGHASQRRALRPPLPARLSVQLVPKRARPSAGAGAGAELPGLPPLLPR